MLANWIGAIISPNSALLLFASNKDRADEAIRRIIRIGYQVLGYNGFTIDEWKAAGGEVTVPTYAKPEDLAKNPDRVVVDVRN